MEKSGSTQERCSEVPEGESSSWLEGISELTKSGEMQAVLYVKSTLCQICTKMVHVLSPALNYIPFIPVLPHIVHSVLSLSLRHTYPYCSSLLTSHLQHFPYSQLNM